MSDDMRDDLGDIHTDAPGKGDLQADSTEIGSRNVVRIVVISDAHQPPSSARLDAQEGQQPVLPYVRLLIAVGHVVSVVSQHDWMMEPALNTKDDLKPEIIIVDGATDAESLIALCREVQRAVAPCCTSVLVALRANEDLPRDIINTLLNSGVDDVFITGARDDEILARVNALSRLSRLRGELEVTRDYLRLHLQTDDVTRLLNRRFFFQAAHREYGRARRYDTELSCLMINVNFFKRLSATFGYDSTDHVLRNVANILRDHTRDSDIIARFSEDKFVIILPETPIAGALAVQENIQRAINEHDWSWQGQQVPVSLSIGEAARRRDTASSLEASTQELDNDNEVEDELVATLSLREELAELLEEADSALFVARRGVRSPFGATTHVGAKTHLNAKTRFAPTPPETSPDAHADLPSFSI